MKEKILAIGLFTILYLNASLSQAAFSFGTPKQTLDLKGGIDGTQTISCSETTPGLPPILTQTIKIPSDAPNWTAQIKLYADSNTATKGFFTYSDTNLVTNRTTNYFVADKNYSGTWTSSGGASSRKLTLMLYKKWQNNAGTTPPTVPAAYPGTSATTFLTYRSPPSH